ncbi:hypothetical protein A2867_01385 [Candidatus Daviesbacteria bacterium RIFCSPHIGHO2_01_FULL_40_11]|uniref:Antitoxin n=1 Tax=Candidatus Daviesbacteria bacterium RIFCSPHIGHO2_01_FULL_40_11 TaxID=1797762 RepID=A0A1F5JG41_9BACT|nr:MAG: hypothetical protein A2867_01385 [Candidatus Daviesbacteria bacterium RIFCSPHIGHO2_01_FULL_40_11]
MRKYITSKSDIMGGVPCIVGTRIPIDVILYRLKEGNTLKDLHKMYPWVGLEKFEGVLEELARKVNKFSYDKTVSQTQTTA